MVKSEHNRDYEHRKTVFTSHIVLFLIFLTPIGIYLAIKYRPEWFKSKYNAWVIVTLIFYTIFWFVVVGSLFSNASKSPQEVTTTQTITIENTVTETETIILSSETITVDETITFSEERIEDPDLLKGKEEISQEGVDGDKTVTYLVQLENGIEVSRTKLWEEIVKKPVKQIILVGTYVAPTNTSATPTNTSASTTKEVMKGITIEEAEYVTYERKSYQNGWSAGGGCNIRARILQETSIVTAKTNSTGCTVTYGSWIDPYTGSLLTGNPYRGDGTANDLDIDHIIPLNYVNSHGGYYWSSSQKKSYGQSLEAMNNGVYVAVSSSENRRKSDSGPSEYYPPNPDYRCEYSRKWRDIARIYGISLSSADYDIIATTLISCGD